MENSIETLTKAISIGKEIQETIQREAKYWETQAKTCEIRNINFRKEIVFLKRELKIANEIINTEYNL